MATPRVNDVAAGNPAPSRSGVIASVAEVLAAAMPDDAPTTTTPPTPLPAPVKTEAVLAAERLAEAEAAVARSAENTAMAEAGVAGVLNSIAACDALAVSLEAARLEAKNDAIAFRDKTFELAAAKAEGERLGLLLNDARSLHNRAVKLEDTIKDMRDAAEYGVRAARLSMRIANVIETSAAFYGALNALNGLVTDLGTRARAFNRKTGNFLEHESLSTARGLLLVLQNVQNIVGAGQVRNGSLLSAWADRLRAYSGQPAPKPTDNYGMAEQVEDLVAGTYSTVLHRVKNGIPTHRDELRAAAG